MIHLLYTTIMKQRYSRKNLRLKSKRSKKVMRQVMKKGGSVADISLPDAQLTQLFESRRIQADNETKADYDNYWLTEIITVARKIIEDNKQFLVKNSLYETYVKDIDDLETQIKSGMVDK